MMSSDKAIKEKIKLFLDLATTPEPPQASISRIVNGVVFRYCPERNKLTNELFDLISSKKHYKNKITKEEIDDILYRNASKPCARNEYPVTKTLNELKNATKQDLVFIVESHAISFSESVQRLSFGEVKCLSLETFSKEYPAISLERDSTESPVSQPSVFLVNVRCSKKSISSNAYWKIDVVLSLLRLFINKSTLPHHPNYLPTLGKTERPINKAHLIQEYWIKGQSEQSDMLQSYSSFLLYHYSITSVIVQELERLGFENICLAIFNSKEKSVSEALERSLGWMSKARRTEDLASRFLFFFTALEALLTSSDKQDPVTDTISRNVSIIRSNNFTERYTIYNLMKNLYGIRSTLVHSGKVEVITTDCDRLQMITERVCLTVIDNCLDMTKEDFLNGLKQASFGQEWPLQKQ